MKKRGRSKRASSRSYLENKKKLIPKSKRSQEIFGVSFGMIFAIILIIFFIAMAIYVITIFLHMQDCAKLGIFVKNLNDKVDNVWNSNDASYPFTGGLPSSIKYVCFANLSENFVGKNEELIEIKGYDHKDNLFFYPPGDACDIPGHDIKHLDVSAITYSENPMCIKVQNGKVNLMIEKENNEPLVRITR